MIRNSFITSDVARVFRPAGVARRSLAGLKTCATSGERGKVGYETGCDVRFRNSRGAACSAPGGPRCTGWRLDIRK